MQCSGCHYYAADRCFYLGGETSATGFCDAWIDKTKPIITDDEPAIWVAGECPKCDGPMVALDNFGLRCFMSGCGWQS